MPPVKTLDFVAVTDADLDNDTFESALNNLNKIITNKRSRFMAYNASFPRDSCFES
jgi:hypothetical protein